MSPSRIKVTNIRSLDSKVYPTISGPLAEYLRDLAKTGLYGHRPTDVARSLIQHGVQEAVASGFIQARRKAE